MALKRWQVCTIFLLMIATFGCVRPPQETQRTLLPPSEQVVVRDGWLEIRHGMLLDMMRRHDVAMWIVVNEEFHDDPLTELVAPALPYVGNRDLFVFIDTGEAGLRRLAITRYADKRVQRFFESPDEPRPPKEALPELLTEHDPATIALSIGGRRGVMRSLTHSSYEWLVEIVGPEMSSRFVSAEDLIEEYLDTRIPEELEHYTTAVALTSELGRRAFSNEVIEPGVTTVGDIRNWLLDAYWANGVEPWFLPDIRVQRPGRENPTSRGFLAVESEETVIERGDLLHLDIGFDYMGLATDWQKMAYVLPVGEIEAPEGLRRALKKTNQLQDALCRAATPGRAAGEVYTEVMAEMEALGIEAQIYSHPLGNHGHGVGPSVDFRSANREDGAERQEKTLRPGSYIAVELNSASEIPEWDNKKVWIMEEDPGHLTAEGYQYFVPRQEDFYLVK